MTEPIIAYWFARSDEQGRVYSPNKPREKWVVGQTRTLKGTIIPCRHGFHGSPTLRQALFYAPGEWACKIELSGTVVPHGDDKLAGSTKTLLAAVNVERDLRLYLADCAEHVLPIWEAKYPEDDRVRKCIVAARAFANGEITAEELAKARDAAWDAAWTAAGAAAWDAAGDGEQAWQREAFECRFAGIFEGVS